MVVDGPLGVEIHQAAGVEEHMELFGSLSHMQSQ